MKQIKAILFDGKSSRSVKALIFLMSDKVIIKYEKIEKFYNLKDLQVETPMPGSVLYIEFPDGARSEILPEDYDSSTLNLLLKKESKFIVWLENNMSVLLGMTFVTIAFIFFMIQYGAPFFSKHIAIRIPQEWANKLDKKIAENMSSRYIQESEIPVKERKELLDYIEGYKNIPTKILIKKSKSMGVNAFALSGESIYFTDDIIKHYKNKKHLLAIYMHEEGHLVHRHVLSSLVSAATLNVMSLMIIGDMAGMTESLANLGMTLISLKHSRDFEKNADDYAVKRLIAKGISPKCFSEALQLLKDAHKEKLKNMPDFDYLSTHPNIEERIQRLERISQVKSEC